MTDAQLVKYIIKNKKLPLSVDDYTNFLVLLLPPTFTLLGGLALYRYFFFDRYLFLVLGGIFLVITGPFFMYLTIVRLKQNITFSTISNDRNIDIDQLVDLISNNLKLDNIKVDKKHHKISAITKTTAFSWGERITIVLNGSDVLVNSRPASGRQPYTITKDIKNIRSIRKLIEGPMLLT